MTVECITQENKRRGTARDAVPMLRVLFVTGASHQTWMVNMNHYQRVYFLSRQARLTVFGRKGADFSSSAADDTEIVHAPFKSKLGVILACFFWMIARGRSRHFDVILTDPSKLCICGLFGKIILGGKWVVDVWDIPFRCQSRLLWRRCRCRISRIIARGLFKFADLFILSILPDLEFAEFDVPREKMLLLKNAIWLDKPIKDSIVDSGSLKFTILCMRSHFSQDCGLDILAEAFELLNKSCDNIELTIVGRIPKVVRPQVELLGRSSNVFFREFVEHDELMQMIQHAGACVIPHRNTPDLSQIHPIKVLEYIAIGSVVVASDLAGISSMIHHGQNGLLFRAGDASDLAEKLRMLYEHPEYAGRISQRAAALGDEFDCRNKAKVILDALEKLCVREEPEIVGALREG